jgi:uncharacterized membrane protein (UPF0136 family)
LPYLKAMLDPTRFFYYLFGLITLGGGIQAFVHVGSKASLIAGGISGILLLVAGWLLQSGQVTPGLVLGLIVTLGLAGRFLPKFFKDGGWWPAGVEGWLGLVGLVLTIFAFVKKS